MDRTARRPARPRVRNAARPRASAAASPRRRQCAAATAPRVHGRAARLPEAGRRSRSRCAASGSTTRKPTPPRRGARGPRRGAGHVAAADENDRSCRSCARVPAGSSDRSQCRPRTSPRRSPSDAHQRGPSASAISRSAHAHRQRVQCRARRTAAVEARAQDSRNCARACVRRPPSARGMPMRPRRRRRGSEATAARRASASAGRHAALASPRR